MITFFDANNLHEGFLRKDLLLHLQTCIYEHEHRR